MASYPAYADHHDVESASGAFFKVATILLGFAVGVVGFVALMLWSDARNARDEASGAPVAAQPANHDHETAQPLNSFAGIVPANAQALAEAHKAYDATLPPAISGSVAKVHMTLKDMTVQIAPGVKYNTWAFDGHGAPGPVIHVREGQTVEMTLTNGGAIPHSIDFHAARIAPERRLQRRDARRVVHVPLQGERRWCLHVPLRHQAGARAHRQRHVRRDHRGAEGGACRRSTTSTSSSAASGT